MKQNQTTGSNKYMESERLFIEFSSQPLSRIQFLHSVSNQFKLISDCDALEMRVFDQALQYRWFTNFKTKSAYDEMEFRIDEKQGRIPVLKEETALEEICLDMFQKRYDPLLQFEYSLNSRYIEDTSGKVNMARQYKNKVVDLSVTGFKAILLLPFTVQNNPPGIIILYSKKKQFINKEDVSAYEDLMHSLSISLKFRRALYALNERIKELTCLYTINQIYQDNSDEPEALVQKIVEHIPKAFQYSEVAFAVIKIGKNEFIYGKKQKTGNYISCNIELEGKNIGTISVFYPGFVDTEEPMHFLPEEQQLLDIISQKVSLIYEKITHRQDKLAMEEQLRHADRLATIGQLASGIAHELNDPLANILGYAQLLLKTVTDERQKSDLERIVRSSLHSREIVRKLLMFARQMPTQKSKIQLNKIVTDTLDLLKNRLEQNKVKLVLNLLPELPLLTVDSSQMTQLVTNLVVNALQAMQSGGKLHISTTSGENTLVMEIADTGCGIPLEELDKIFLPFYSTKPVGEGTGLGLSVVHGIVSSHNGAINVVSKPGKGSKFIIELPVSAQNQK